MLVHVTEVLTLPFQILPVLAAKNRLIKSSSLFILIRYQVTGDISTGLYTSLTHRIKSHATFSAADAFQKLLNDKNEISFNHVYLNQTSSPPEKVFAPRLRQIQLYEYNGILISAPS